MKRWQTIGWLYFCVLYCISILCLACLIISWLEPSLFAAMEYRTTLFYIFFVTQSRWPYTNILARLSRLLKLLDWHHFYVVHIASLCSFEYVSCQKTHCIYILAEAIWLSGLMEFLDCGLASFIGQPLGWSTSDNNVSYLLFFLKCATSQNFDQLFCCTNMIKDVLCIRAFRFCSIFSKMCCTVQLKSLLASRTY